MSISFMEPYIVLRDLTKDNSLFERFGDFEAYRHVGFLSPLARKEYRRLVVAADDFISSSGNKDNVDPHRINVDTASVVVRDVSETHPYDCSRNSHFYSVDIESGSEVVPIILKYGGDFRKNLRFQSLFDGSPKNNLIDGNAFWSATEITTEADFNLDPGPAFRERTFHGFARKYVDAFIGWCDERIREIKKSDTPTVDGYIYAEDICEEDMENLTKVQRILNVCRKKIKCVKETEPIQISLSDPRPQNIIYTHPETEVSRRRFEGVDNLVFIDQLCHDKRFFYGPIKLNRIFASLYFNKQGWFSRRKTPVRFRWEDSIKEEKEKIEILNKVVFSGYMMQAEDPIRISKIKEESDFLLNSLGFIRFYIRERNSVRKKLEMRKESEDMDDIADLVELLNGMCFYPIESIYERSVLNH